MPRPRSLLSATWRPPLRVPALQSRSSRDIHRITTSVAGDEVWFESPDLSLADAIEAIGSAFVIPAAAAGRRLMFESSPDAVWLDNAERARTVAAEWWGYGNPVRSVVSESTPVAASGAGRHTALCFTGGVDSFYSLLRGEWSADSLLFIHGYDIELADTKRVEAAETSLRCVAAARELRAVLVRTNLRTHRAFRKANWEHAHGGALAAIGHLLSDHVNQLLISASYPRVFDRPWGSHWALDPWWSSSRLTVTHVDVTSATLARLLPFGHTIWRPMIPVSPARRGCLSARIGAWCWKPGLPIPHRRSRRWIGCVGRIGIRSMPTCAAGVSMRMKPRI